MSDFAIKPATRTGVIPAIGMFGRSGNGKTFSALMLARGLVGPSGRVCVLDSENGRASLFADIIPGGYEVIAFEPPFSPERYSEALDLMQANSDVAVLDSQSHEWAGEGGVLEMQEEELQRMAGDDYKRREACKMAAWIKPKMRHKAFIQKLLRSKIPVICCLRAQEKTHMVKDDKGKNQVVTDEFTSPIYDERFIFELLCNIETVMVDGKPGCGIIRKWSHPELLKCLPKPGEQIAVRHGELIAQWCSAPMGKPAALKPWVPTTEDKLKSVKREIWNITEHVHRGNSDSLQTWLHDEFLMVDTEWLKDLTLDTAKVLLGLVKSKLEKQKEVTP